VSAELEVVHGEVELSLAENEEIISRGMASFVRVGEALARIRDSRQYVGAGFDTFEDYCKGKWDMGESHANRHIDASRVVALVTPIGVTPANIEQTRPLVKLLNNSGDAAVLQKWREIVSHHDGDGPITGREVSRYLTHGATYGKPSWHELVGAVGDHLIAASKAMDKADDAVTRQPNAKLQGKLAEYASHARALADRLDAMREWRA
jgi:hypothetical protein